MSEALAAWLRVVEDGGSVDDAVRAAAHAVRASPWEVVRDAGVLARCTVGRAERDLGLNAELRVLKATSEQAIVRIDEGKPYPVPRNAGRRARGAYDTSVDMARRVVATALEALETPPQVALDPACGTGAFLLALREAGVPDVRGTDTDPAAVTVARVAVPGATIVEGDAFDVHAEQVDLVVGNPPFVAPERQDKALRTALRQRYPWLKGRFDLVVPFAAAAVERCRSGGVVGLVLPAAALVQPYGAGLRRRWLQRHRIVSLSGPHAFPGASVQVMLLVLVKDAGPASVFGVPAERLLSLDNVPLDANLKPGDIDLVARVRARSGTLGDLCEVDTGVVAHSPGGSKQDLLYDEPGEGRVPYADARDFFAGRRRWLQYTPGRMHRAKRPALFEQPKIVVQRLRGNSAVRADLDTTGVYVGHTCTVVRPHDDRVPAERLLHLLRSPLVDGVIRVERGRRLDLYPKDVRGIPVPERWLDDPETPLAEAWSLTADEVQRLQRLAAHTDTA